MLYYEFNTYLLAKFIYISSEVGQVFNMGHRLEIYTNEAHADTLIDIARSMKIDAQIIGEVRESPEKKLIIRSEFGEFGY